MITTKELEDLLGTLKNGIIVLKIKDENIVELDFKQKLKEKDIKKLLKDKENNSIIRM